MDARENGRTQTRLSTSVNTLPACGSFSTQGSLEICPLIGADQKRWAGDRHDANSPERTRRADGPPLRILDARPVRVGSAGRSVGALLDPFLVPGRRLRWGCVIQDDVANSYFVEIGGAFPQLPMLVISQLTVRLILDSEERQTFRGVGLCVPDVCLQACSLSRL
jgi:hypothetical protein